MPHLGPMELLLILGIIIVLFGARRLPELGRGLGQGIKGFKESIKDDSTDNQETDQSDDKS